jgi:hypothetical protein
MGYRLSRTARERLLSRWQTQYPELPDSVLAVAHSAKDTALQVHRQHCWDALARESGLPAWQGAVCHGRCAGDAIPPLLKNMCRVDP